MRSLNVLEIAGSGAVGTAHAGPVSLVIACIANGLVQRGHRVTVLDAPSSAPRVHLGTGIDVLEVIPARSRRRATSRLGALANLLTRSGVVARHAADTVGRSAFDIVHVHHPAIVSMLRRRCRLPVIWTVHNANWTLEHKHRFRPGAIVTRAIDRASARAATRVVALNEQTKRVLGRGNASVIPNGLDLSQWPILARDESRARLGIPAAEFHVTCVGRISPEKGIHVFAEAVKIAARNIPIVADVIGSPTGGFRESKWRSAYAAGVISSAPHVQFHGFIPRDRPEFRQRMAAADAIVIPSITEPFGLVVLEALACGARVIGADTGGIRDMLGKGAGVLVPPGDAPALARAIAAQFHRGVLPRDSVTARERAAEYSWDRTVAQYATVMHDAARAAAEPAATGSPSAA